MEKVDPSSSPKKNKKEKASKRGSKRPKLRHGDDVSSTGGGGGGGGDNANAAASAASQQEDSTKQQRRQVKQSRSREPVATLPAAPPAAAPAASPPAPPVAQPVQPLGLPSVGLGGPGPGLMGSGGGGMMRPFWSYCCASCSLPREERTSTSTGGGRVGGEGGNNNESEALLADYNASTAASPQRNLALTNGHPQPPPPAQFPQPPPAQPTQLQSQPTVEHLIHQYKSACALYGCSDRINAGVLTTLRFSLPTLRASGSFHDADMLALCEILMMHCNGALSFVKRLDFSIASKEGKLHGRRGFRSHGAFTLSKVLSESRHIEEVFLQRNRIGPYGSSAIFLAASTNPYLRTLVMRRCSIGERGALAFAEHVCSSEISGLKEIDLSVNGIGFKGTIAVETALSRREEGDKIECDLEGNLVFQEVMNCVTHGLGILLSIVAFFVLSHRVRDKTHRHTVSCAIYSFSLLVLYTSSTLYHSFFALQVTRYIFFVLDKCAIYILIAGSYTPYLQIALWDKPKWSIYLLAFIWLCCICGVSVEAFFPNWKYKPKFSLSMYLGMGWACVVCMPDLVTVIPPSTINLLVLGGVGYTSGVPFFVRNNNLDHSIWHCFVLAGSIFHWCGVYIIAGMK